MGETQGEPRKAPNGKYLAVAGPRQVCSVGTYARDKAVPAGCRAGQPPTCTFIQVSSDSGAAWGHLESWRAGWLSLCSVQVPEGTRPSPDQRSESAGRICLPPTHPRSQPGDLAGPSPLSLSSSVGQLGTSARAAPPAGEACGSGACAAWRPRTTACGRCPPPGAGRWPRSQRRWNPAVPSPAPLGEHGGADSPARAWPGPELPLLDDPFPKASSWAPHPG